MIISEREKRLAYILGAFASMDSERAEYMTEWKARRTKLENELKDICNEIITGQAPLALESVEEEVSSVPSPIHF